MTSSVSHSALTPAATRARVPVVDVDDVVVAVVVVLVSVVVVACVELTVELHLNAF